MLKALEGKTKLEVVDYVTEHMRQQGFKRSMGKNSGCAYRGDDGRVCGIGALISDEEYAELGKLAGEKLQPGFNGDIRTNIEGLVAETLVYLSPDIAPPEMHDLLKEIQCAHDAYNSDGMEASFRNLRARVVNGKL